MPTRNGNKPTSQQSTPSGVLRTTILKRLRLQNYRCFEDLTIEFEDDLTVLIARNGVGKSAVLDAIAVAFGTFVGSFMTGRTGGADADDVRLVVTRPELREMEPQFPLAIDAQGHVDGQALAWGRRVNSAKSGTTIKEAKSLTMVGKALQEAVTENRGVRLPLIAYYGTGRLWRQKKKTEKKSFDSEFHSRTAGYQDCLDPASSYKYFLDWFRYAAESDADIRNRQQERLGQRAVGIPTPFTPLISAVSGAVDTCLASTGWKNLRYSFTHRKVVMENDQHGVLEVDRLSDGVRNMVAMVADIAYRMVRLNSDLGAQAARCTPGIVLIDEVDMHLHPQWQQEVLGSLQKAFPAVQFIVTTHSPQVVSTVKRANVRVLDLNQRDELVAVSPSARTYGRSSADVLQAAMGVEPEPRVAESDDLQAYLRIAEQGDIATDVARDLRQQLDAALGADHPLLRRADMAVRRRRAVGDLVSSSPTRE